MPFFILLFLVAALAAQLSAADSPAVTLQMEGATVRAIDVISGQERWRFESDAALFEPVLSEGQAFLTGRSGVLQVLRASDVIPRWTLTTDDDWLYPPLPIGDRVIVVGRHSGLRALARADGTELWRLTLAQEPTYSPIALTSRHILVTLFNGTLLALNAENGRQIWRAQFPNPALNISVDGGRILFGSYGNRLRAVSTKDGRLLWSQPLPGRVALPPVVAGGTAIVVTDEHVIVLADATTGAIHQRLRSPGETTAILQVNSNSIDVLIRNGNKGEPRPVSIAAHKAIPIR